MTSRTMKTLRRFDRKRSKKGEKNVSNTDWELPTDPDSRIVKMRFSPDPLLMDRWTHTSGLQDSNM